MGTNVLLVSIDSLGRHWLEPFGRRVELPVEVPNLARLAERSALFDRHWAGSLPCMPARREFLAGVLEFPWRPWGPLEPFDRPLARVAREAGIRTALVTDHYHYWSHGSHGYYEDFDTWEFIRGHEYDAHARRPARPDPILLRQLLAPETEPHGFFNRWQYARNVHGFSSEEEFFAPRVFSRAAVALEELAALSDRWFLYVDSFDVHEPFHCPEPYASMFTDEDPRDPELVVWPRYGTTDALSERQLAFVRAQFAGKLAMVDRWLGRILDTLDKLRLWDTTTVVLTSDHGHFLGEHGYVGKPFVPVYDELARTPLLISHPETGSRRVDAVTSAVDVYATIADALGVGTAGGPHSRSLLPLVRGETDVHRRCAVYGWFGGAVNVSDGRHTLLCAPRTSREVDCYSSAPMATHPSTSWFEPVQASRAAVAGFHLPYADVPVWRWPAGVWPQGDRDLLFDVERDPGQLVNLVDSSPELADELRALLRDELAELGVPAEVVGRVGLV